MALARQQAANEPFSPRPPGLGGEFRPVPPDPPRPIDLTFRVCHLGGHPGLRPGEKRLWLWPGASAAIVFADPRCEREVAVLEYGKVRAMRVEGPDTVQSRVTIPRVAVGGLFAFAKKKQDKEAYLVFEPHVGGEVIFHVSGYTPWELRGALSPLLHWLDGDPATIAELGERQGSVPPPQAA
jgi:hypothetical protein